MYHDHSQAIYQILLTHYLYLVFSHNFCSVVFTDITFIISIFFVSWSKLSSPLRIQTRANFREPALGSSGLSQLFFFHSCSRMNYFSGTISFFRLLICYPTLLDREDRAPLFVAYGAVAVFSYAFLKEVSYLDFCWSVDILWCWNTVVISSDAIFAWSLTRKEFLLPFSLFSNVPFVVGKVISSINCFLQLYWNHTSAWVFSCKFAAYFQDTFS